MCNYQIISAKLLGYLVRRKACSAPPVVPAPHDRRLPSPHCPLPRAQVPDSPRSQPRNSIAILRTYSVRSLSSLASLPQLVSDVPHLRPIQRGKVLPVGVEIQVQVQTQIQITRLPLSFNLNASYSLLQSLSRALEHFHTSSRFSILKFRDRRGLSSLLSPLSPPPSPTSSEGRDNGLDFQPT